MNQFRTKEIEKLVQASLAPAGLMSFGWFSDNGQAGLLMGNVGSGLWPAFSTSPEYDDAQPDPLNRWTRRIVDPVANAVDAEVRYPFGEQLWPFQRYARAATGMKQSPLGLLIHPQFGLWTAFRAVLIFDYSIDPKTIVTTDHPCDDCVEKPCLNICPVGAFSGKGYDYPSCRAHIASSQGRMCLEFGCRARVACPVGEHHAYDADHQAFHMQAFVG